MTNGTEIIKNLPDQVKKRKAAEVPVKAKKSKAGKPFDPDKLEQNLFHVFHGRHRLLAVKEIEKNGELSELEGFENNSITCHIVNISSGGSIQANYGAFRGNDIQAKFTRPPYLHELCYVLEKVRQPGDQEKCVESMMRYGKMLEFGADNLTALRKFCNWSQESLAELCQVLRLYETC